jgi:predicted nuclease of predicted toxin-antitoxin system
VMHDVFQSNGSVNSMVVTRDDDFVSQSVVRDDRVGSEMIVGESLNDDAERMLVSE